MKEVIPKYIWVFFIYFHFVLLYFLPFFFVDRELLEAMFPENFISITVVYFVMPILASEF